MLGLLLLFTLAGCATQGDSPNANTAMRAPAAAPTATPDDDNGSYPIKNPLVATVVGTPKKLRADLPADINLSVRQLKPLVERDTPPTLRYAQPLQYLLAAQSKPAPLVFVIAGTGASALSGKCVLLSKALYAIGYSVACLPSPTSVTFMLGAASHPVPGRMRTDVDDLYRMMGAIRDDLSEKLDITGYALTGWSLGATEAAFVAHKDATEHQFDFHRVLLLDPAVSVWASVKRMDTLLDNNLPGGIDRLPSFLAGVLGDIKQFYVKNQDLSFNADTLFAAYEEKGSHNPQRAAALIGIAFRLSLANMAFAADQLTHADVIVPKDVRLGLYDPLDLYFHRSIRKSFTDYINELLVPYWNSHGRHVSKSQLITEADLHRIASFLGQDRKLAVFANADDPILDAEDVSFLRQTFGGRARIRPHGGHLGNLAYKKTIRALQDYFSP